MVVVGIVFVASFDVCFFSHFALVISDARVIELENALFEVQRNKDE